MEFATAGEVCVELSEHRTTEPMSRMYQADCLMVGAQYQLVLPWQAGVRAAYASSGLLRCTLMHAASGEQNAQELTVFPCAGSLIVEIPYMEEVAVGTEYLIRAEMGAAVGYSRQFGIVKYVLALGQVPEVVFKDDKQLKYIDMPIELRDFADRLVTAHEPLGELQLRLLYDDFQEVPKNILRVPTTPVQVTNGRALVRSHITDVSKNHLGRKFRIELAAAPTAAVRSIVTAGIQVKSKITRSKRSASPSYEQATSPTYDQGSGSEEDPGWLNNILGRLEVLEARNTELEQLRMVVAEQRIVINQLWHATYGPYVAPPQVEDISEESSPSKRSKTYPTALHMSHHGEVSELDEFFPSAGPSYLPISEPQNSVPLQRQDSFQQQLRLNMPGLASLRSEDFSFQATSRGMYS